MRNVKFTKLSFALLFVITLLASAPQAGATPVLPGQAVPTSLLAAAAGTLLASTSQPLPVTTGMFSGTLRAAVYRNTVGDPLSGVCPAGGCLDFYYQVVNNPTSIDQIARETNINFVGFLTGVAFRLDGGSLSSGAAMFTNGSRAPDSGDRNSAADTVGFLYLQGNRILPGETSVVLVVQTNATLFTSGFSNVIDGGVATVPTFQPTNIPEPASLVLMGVGLLGLAAIRRRRSK